MEIKKLRNIIKKEEGIKLDFKQTIDLESEASKRELAKDVCAIANSKGGRGYIVIGVEDKTKKIVGVNEHEFKEEQIQQIVSSRCEPPIPISVEGVENEGKTLIIITIYDGIQKPYQLRDNGAFYIRRGSTTDTMRKQEIISALQENLNFNIETCPILRSSIKDLDFSLIDKYLSIKGVDVNDDNRISLMEAAGIIYRDRETEKYCSTLGGLLVFCDANSIFVPHNIIRIINKINRDFDEITLISGNLINMLNKAENILNKILPEKYPAYAVYEGLKNAVLYRDYASIYDEIELIVDFNSVSVISPGILIKSNKYQDVNSNNYIKRNMWLYEKLVTLDNRQIFLKTGRGFVKMKKAFKNHGRVIFVNSIENDNFKVIYPGINHF